MKINPNFKFQLSLYMGWSGTEQFSNWWLYASHQSKWVQQFASYIHLYMTKKNLQQTWRLHLPNILLQIHHFQYPRSTSVWGFYHRCHTLIKDVCLVQSFSRKRIAVAQKLVNQHCAVTRLYRYKRYKVVITKWLSFVKYPFYYRAQW